MMNDQRIEIIVANLLRAGVLLAATVVLIGGIGYLGHHGQEVPEYRVFHGAAAKYRSIGPMAAAAAQMDWRAVIQLGLMILIATPVARVGFSLVAFGAERDRTYVVITAIVLAILIYGLVAPHGG